MARVRAFKSRFEGMAECESCRIDVNSTRDQTRDHTQETGHVTHFIIEESITYKKEQK